MIYRAVWQNAERKSNNKIEAYHRSIQDGCSFFSIFLYTDYLGKKEGIIFGLCVKMFTVAGPVIVSGIVASVIVGIIYMFI